MVLQHRLGLLHSMSEVSLSTDSSNSLLSMLPTPLYSYWPLPKASQNIMRATLSGVKLDEISMVSSINLAFVHMRREELFGSSEWFGYRNMLFVGDLLQLPPVHGNPVFDKVAILYN